MPHALVTYRETERVTHLRNEQVIVAQPVVTPGLLKKENCAHAKRDPCESVLRIRCLSQHRTLAY